jgi:hypothetical protein
MNKTTQSLMDLQRSIELVQTADEARNTLFHAIRGAYDVVQGESLAKAAQGSMGTEKLIRAVADILETPEYQDWIADTDGFILEDVNVSGFRDIEWQNTEAALFIFEVARKMYLPVEMALRLAESNVVQIMRFESVSASTLDALITD